MKKKKLAVLFALCPLLSLTADAQSVQPDFTGMWSDPPDTLEGTLCFFACFDGGLDKLYALLDDPVNDDTPVPQLVQQVMQEGFVENIAPKLTAKGRENFPLDQGKDPSFLECIPWGFAREIFSPHQLRIEQHADYIEMQYGEWDITRTVHLSNEGIPQNTPYSKMGYSVGHYEADTLVIETSHITENIMFFVASHSDQLHTVERYRKSADGEALNLEVTLTDPIMLTAPIVAKKLWSWAPDQEIFAYDSCNIPDTDLIIEGV